MVDHATITIALAALLHDIGKVGQRAHPNDQLLSWESKGLESSICPTGTGGYYSHRHVLWTNEFLLKTKPIYPKGIDFSKLANLACYHHKPDNPETQLIAEADQLSAAMDREESEEEFKQGVFRRIPLTPVVKMVGQSSALASHSKHHFLPQPFSPDKVIPQENEVRQDLTDYYKTVWDALIDEASNIKLDDTRKLANSILMILEKYLWAVPSATNVKIPDISLFDHMKTTSAIATCLYLTENKEKPFILAAAEFGGIQKYIFDINPGAGGIAKGLRGRSFLVSLTTDTTASSILDCLGLPMTNLLVIAGGKFYLLLPNTQKAKETLIQYHEKAHHWILKQHNGEIRLNFGFLEITKDDIMDFAGTAKFLNDYLFESGLRGLKGLKSDNNWNEGQWLLESFSDTNQELCPSCKSRKATENWKDGRLCSSCLNDREIGSNLVKTDQVLISFDPDYDIRLPFASLDLKPTIENAEIADLIIKFDFEHTPQRNKPYFTILKNNHVPKQEDDILEFGEIAAKASGAKFLAFLAADIDDLGFQFSAGFKNPDYPDKDRRSISRVATLSRELEYFFSGYLRYFLEKRYPYTYTVFSGGDDLLFIGPWDKMFHLAKDLQSDFQKFTCGNTSWGISAGLAVVGAKAPVLFSYKVAKEHLSLSKKSNGQKSTPDAPAKSKNKITAFGKTLTWPEFSRALDQAEQVVAWIADDTLNTGKIYRFLHYGQQLDQFHLLGDTALLKVVPQMIYDLARNWGDSTENEQKAKAWAHQFTNPEFSDSRLLSFICQYALLKSRKDGGNGEM